MAAHQVNVYFWLIDTIASGRLTREDINLSVEIAEDAFKAVKKNHPELG
jgi:hypothetical protein